MTEITLENDFARDVRFTGEKIADASSFSHLNDQRWTELALYRTRAGKLILHTRGMTRWQGERCTSAVEILETEYDVLEALYDAEYKFEPHLSDVEKDLLNRAGIDYAVEVE